MQSNITTHIIVIFLLAILQPDQSWNAQQQAGV